MHSLLLLQCLKSADFKPRPQLDIKQSLGAPRYFNIFFVQSSQSFNTLASFSDFHLINHHAFARS
jgi:hypothetical protein